MLNTYYSREGRLSPGAEGDLHEAFWIDLYEPSREEEQRVEAALRLEVPTRDEMREVESSSALYNEHGATFVTIRVVDRANEEQARLTSITLILTAGPTAHHPLRRTAILPPIRGPDAKARTPVQHARGGTAVLAGNGSRSRCRHP